MYLTLDKCMMSALLRCLSHPCHSDDMGMSTKNWLPSLSITCSGYNECIVGPLASRRFPLWSVYPPEEKPARILSSSNCLTEITGHESSSTCWTLHSTSVEPPARLSSTLPISIISQCCEFPTQIESECRVVYCWNWDRWGVTWKDAPKSMSHVLDSSIVSKISELTGFSIDSMFGAFDNTSAEEMT